MIKTGMPHPCNLEVKLHWEESFFPISTHEKHLPHLRTLSWRLETLPGYHRAQRNDPFAAIYR